MVNTKYKMNGFKKITFFLAIAATSAVYSQQYETIPITLGMRVATVRYTEVGLPAKGVIPVFQGALMGFVDYDGEVVLEPTYEKDGTADSYRFYNGRMKVKKNGKYGFVNEKAEEVIPCRFDEANDFHNSLSAVKKDGLWGYINYNNEQVVPFGYKKVYPFSNGMAAVINESDSIGFVNEYGLIAIPFEYDNVGTPSFQENGLCKIHKDGAWIFIDKDGNSYGKDEQKALKEYQETYPDRNLADDSVKRDSISVEKVSAAEQIKKLTAKRMYSLAEAPYESIGEFKNGYSIVTARPNNGGKKYGMIQVFDGVFTKEGKEILGCEYDNIEGPYLGPVEYFIVEKNGKYGVCKTDGTQVLPSEYDEIGKEGTELFHIKKNGLVGFADTTGRVVVPCQYEAAKPFNYTYTCVGMRKKGQLVWNFIDQTGKVVSEPEYDDASTFQNGVCPVVHKGKWGFVAQDLVLFSPKYEYSFSDDHERWSYRNSEKGDPIPVSKGGKFGFINLDGKDVVKPQYEDASAFVWGTARVQKGGKYGLIDKTGKEALPFIYDEIEYDYRKKIAIVSKSDKKGIYADGKFLLPCEYTSIDFFTAMKDGKIEQLCYVTKNGVKGVYNLTERKQVVDCRFKTVELKDNVLDANGGEFYYSVSGESLSLKNLSSFVTVKEKNGKYSLFNNNGKALTAYILDQVGSFTNGYAPVKIVNRWGVIDKNGKIVIPCIYEDVKIVADGVVSVRILAKRGLTDVKGEPILPRKKTLQKAEWASIEEETLRVEAK